MKSSDSNLSLPYDEREDCARGNVGVTHNRPQNSLGETRRRSRAPLHRLSDKPLSRGGFPPLPPEIARSSRRQTGRNRGLSPAPSIGAIGSATWRLLTIRFVHTRRQLRKPCRRLRRSLKQYCLTLFGAILLLLVFLLLDFYADAVSTCAPSLEIQGATTQERPLVEYFVHGRGSGHYQRSRAIVAQLNEAGVDVRMFLDRATLWRAYYEDTPDEVVIHTTSNNGRGTTRAIAVTTITPDVGFFDALSHTIERIMGDCKAAFQSSRYPILVVSDGDLPGMLRAKLGGIPSVSISHGQLFNVAQVPEWLPRHMHRAWKKQKRLNGFASFFSNWQIATNFLHLESRLSSGVVARPPLRQEVVLMAQARNDANQSPRYIQHRNLLQPIMASKLLPRNRRRLVMCYFRDGNGEDVLDALLRAGFDVVNFGHEYQNGANERIKPFGEKWIVRPNLNYNDTNFTSEHHRRRLEQTQNDNSPPPQIIQVSNHSLFVPLMSIVDGVVSSAGSQLMSECIFMNLPLLAFYKQVDDEQMLNAEMSRHRDPRKTRVFSSSFESFNAVRAGDINSSLRGYNSQAEIAASVSPFPPEAKGASEAFSRFVQTVQTSNVSQSYFDAVAQAEIGNEVNDATQVDLSYAQQLYEDAFPGMPDAAEIILEIVKKVQVEEEDNR